MAQFPCLPLWTDAWVADTRHLSRVKRGAYMDLLVEMWRTPGCRVPDDNGWLQDHLQATKDEIREVIRPIIAEFCSVEGGWIIQKRLQKEFIATFKYRKRMSELGKRPKTKQKDTNSNWQAINEKLPSLKKE